MRVWTVFPPYDYSVMMPEIGVPLLTAALRAAGHEAVQSDLNLSFCVDHLGRLETFADVLRPLPTDPGTQRHEVLRSVAQALARARGGDPEEVPADLVSSIREQALRSDKSSHLKEFQLTRDWRDDAAAWERSDPVWPQIAALGRHGGRDEDFRRQLQHAVFLHAFAPASFAASDILAAARAPNPLLEGFYAGQLDAQPRPDALGLSIWSPYQLVPALMLARAARERWPGLYVTAGGAWVHYARGIIPEVPQLFDAIDSFVVFEADRSLLSVLARVEAGSDCRGVPGVITRDMAPGHPLELQPPTPFDEIPSPVYDGFPIGRYPRDLLPLRVFRGCHWARCTFCSHVPQATTRQYSFRRDARLSPRTLARLAEHIRHVGEAYGAKTFTMSDNEVTPAVMAQLCDLRAEHGLDFRWSSLARFDQALTPDFCARLAAGGCEQLDLGLETVGEGELKDLSKGIAIDQVREGLRNLHEAGIRATLFILNYPGQTEAQFEETLRFVAEHRDFIAGCGVSRFRLARDTMAWEHPASLGMRLVELDEPHLNPFAVPFTAEHQLSRERFVALTRQYMPGYW